MRILVVGAGGVGGAAAAIARRRGFFERMVLADVSSERAEAAVARLGDDRLGAAQVDARDADAIVALARAEGIDTILNACDPWLNPPIFAAAAAAGCTYLDMAMTLSARHPERPFEETGVMLGDAQFAAAAEWEAAGRLALVRHRRRARALRRLRPLRRRPPVLRDRRGRRARRGGPRGRRVRLRPDVLASGPRSRSASTRRVIWERERGWFTTAPFSEPEVFEFPAGIGPVECVNVEHEEVVLIPRWVDCRRVTFKYGLGDEFIGVLKTLQPARARLDGAAARSRAWRSRRATWSPPRCPTRRRSATR